MAEPASLLPAGRFAAGADRIGAVPADVARLRRGEGPVALIADPAMAAAGLLERVTAPLAAAGLACCVHTLPAGEPDAAAVDGAAAFLRERRPGCVLGLGGGSALDAAKLAAALAPARASCTAYALAARPLPEPPLPLLLVPTTAGTGSEATATAIFSGAGGRKLWTWGEPLRAPLAILDPVLTTGLPPLLTAATGADALVHAIEAYTGRRAGPASDACALAAMRLIAAHLARAVAAPADLEARGAMQRAAALAGLAIDAAGTGVAHALGHALGSLARVHHGRAVALALRAAMAWNAEAAPARHARIAEALGARGGGGDETLAAAAAPAFDALLRAARLPVTLGDHGLGPADAARVAGEAMAPENAPMRENNARPVTRADLERIAAVLLAAD